MFLTVVVAHFLALLSPGPDFVLVVKSGVRNKKQNAIGIALGIASANGVYIALCLLGVGAILAGSIVVMTVLKVCGGLFLLYLAVMALKARKKDYEFLKTEGERDKTTTSFGKEFATGFLSAILNPKNPIFYLSLFTLVLNSEVNFVFKLVLGMWMTSVVFVWDSFIIFVLSRPRVKAVFSRLAFYVDKATGTILGLIGIALMRSAVTEEK
jgi:threonine/homoserine/homoserine lactone efflux protein